MMHLNFLLNDLLGQGFVFLDVILLFLELLPEQFYSILHHTHIGVNFLELVLLVDD